MSESFQPQLIPEDKPDVTPAQSLSEADVAALAATGERNAAIARATEEQRLAAGVRAELGGVPHGEAQPAPKTEPEHEEVIDLARAAEIGRQNIAALRAMQEAKGHSLPKEADRNRYSIDYEAGRTGKNR
jgi:hypothetical protein